MMSLKKIILSFLMMGLCLSFDFLFSSHWGIPVPGVEIIESTTPWMHNISEIVKINPKLAAIPVLCAAFMAGRHKLYKFSENTSQEVAKRIATKEQEIKSNLPMPVRMAYEWCREASVSVLCPLVSNAWEYADHNKYYWVASVIALAGGHVLIFLPGKFFAALITLYGHMDMGSKMLQKKIEDFRSETAASFNNVRKDIANVSAQVKAQGERVFDKVEESKQQIIAQVCKNISELSDQIDILKNDLSGLSKDVSEKVSRVDIKVDHLAKKIGEISHRIVESMQAIAKIDQEAYERNTSIQEALGKVVSFADEFIQIKENFNTIFEQQIKANKCIQEVKNTQEKQDAKIDQLLSDASEKTGLLVGLQGALATVQQNEAQSLKKVEQLIAQTSKKNQQVIELLKKLQKSSHDTIVKLTQNISSVEVALKGIQGVCASLFDRVGKIETTVDIIRTDVSSLKNEQQERKQKDEARDAEIKQLKLLLADLLTQNSTLKKQMEDSVKKIDTSLNVLNEDMHVVALQLQKDSLETRQAVRGLGDQLNNLGKPHNQLAVEYFPDGEDKIVVATDPQIPADFGRSLGRRPGWGSIFGSN